MLRTLHRKILKNTPQFLKYSTENNVPTEADVVIIGGGVAGCSLLYHLTKRGIKAVVLEKAKITSGTTWHSTGVVWRLRPNDVDIRVLEATRKLLISLEDETGLNPGFINNGGLFIAKTEKRIQEYKRLQTLGRYFDVDSHIISSEEAAKISPMLDPKRFKAALYSPKDGCTDPTMYCAALLKAAKSRGGRVIENCPVTNILRPSRKVQGVQTPRGTIKTSCVVNAAGVWAPKIAELVGSRLPMVTIKHGYIVTDKIPEAKGTPNIRDHDGSIYMRIQGDSVCLGGYESHPVVIKNTPNDFQFSLFDFDQDILEEYVTNAADIAPVFESVPIKSNSCSMEGFIPDRKPIMGEDPNVTGLFYSCGYNSLGVNLSSGCAEQLAIWIDEGRPEIPMFTYDVRRFTQKQRSDEAWVAKTTQASYAKNYSIVFPLAQPLAGRNYTFGPLHEVLVSSGAVMEQALSWERPSYFIKDGSAPVQGSNERYKQELEGDYTFEFSKHRELIGEEAIAASKNVALFDISSFTKMYLSGPEAEVATDWLFTADTDTESVVYTCALNRKGGVEVDCTVAPLDEKVGAILQPNSKGKGYYILARGSSGYQPVAHLQKELTTQKFDALITDITDSLGVLSIQGPKSHDLLRSFTGEQVQDRSQLAHINGHAILSTRTESGYELHIPKASCVSVYNTIIDVGRHFNLKLSGFRAMNSLNLEKGHHLWNQDLRFDDNPVEANLEFVCREKGQYLGKEHVDKLKQAGVKKRRVFFTLNDKVAVYGLEVIWRDGAVVGFLRRGGYGYNLDCSIGTGYVEHPKGQTLTDEFLTSGNYEIEILSKRYPATLHLKSPLDQRS